MLPGQLVLVSILYVLEIENMLVNNRLDVVDLDSGVHVLLLLPRTNIDAANGADASQRVQRRCALSRSTDKADQRNDTLQLHRRIRLRKCRLASLIPSDFAL
jgi:hypothetical protein